MLAIKLNLMSSAKFIKEFETHDMSKRTSFYRSAFNKIFPLYHLLLKNYSYSYYKELIFMIFEYLSLISFIFSKAVSLYNINIIIYSFFLFGIIILVGNCFI